MNVRIATRRSPLALAQTRAIAAEIVARNPGTTVTEVAIVTEGDRVTDRPLAEIGGKGLFVTELELALLDGRADLAVHSMKDLPADLAAGLEIACVPPRESPWDLLVTGDGREFDTLPAAARVGTSSLRRAIQLRARRGDLVIEPLRGNVDTRLRKLANGEYAAVVLAEAGVRRLRVSVRAVRLDAIVVPAIGQGALALEARVGDAAMAGLVRGMEDREARVATRVEREVLRAVGGSCVTPIGALARVTREAIDATGFYASLDGTRHATAQARGHTDDPERVGRELADALRAKLADAH